MLAYKFLEQGCSPFTGWRWELPSPGRAGASVEAAGPLALCTNGVHACTVAQLPPWLGRELWVVELAGEILEMEVALVAARARLVEAVSSWDEDARARFALDCAARARRLPLVPAASEPLLERVVTWADGGWAVPVAYWAAVLAGEVAAGTRHGPAYDEAVLVERSSQATWLREHLALSS